MRRRELAQLRGELAETRGELAETRGDVFEESEWGGLQDQMLEHRVALLEEIVAARWPRRIQLRRRLARDLRASVARYGWVSPEWLERRAQAIGDGWGEQS